MTLKRAIRIASAWSQGHVCTLRDGEAEEYHKMALKAFHTIQELEKYLPVIATCREGILDIDKNRGITLFPCGQQEAKEAEKNEPLTIEDLRQMVGQPVWCEDGCGNAGWCLVSRFYSKDGLIGAIDDSTVLWDGNYYGMTGDGKHGLHPLGWLAYRRPLEKERT